MEKGSKPANSFMGSAQIKRNKQIIITKSPRETMLAYQELGDDYDVIGICSGETSSLSETQKEFLKDHQLNWKRVFVSFDRDTLAAEDTAFDFVRTICDEIGTYKRDVRLLNIPKLTANESKDLTDLFKSSHLKQIDKLFEEGSFEFSEYIWNSYTEDFRFWQVDEKAKLIINEVKLAGVLAKFGYKKSYFGQASEPTLVQDELFYVVDGEVEFMVHDKTFIASSGDTIFAPRNIPHAYTFKAQTKMLTAAIPGGFERMFREVNEMEDQSNIPEVVSIFNKYGVYLVENE